MVFRCLYSSPEKPGQIVPPFLRCKCSFAPDLPFAQRSLVQRGFQFINIRPDLFPKIIALHVLGVAFSNGKRKYQQAAAYILMLNTGLRTGELLGLLNSDIDLEHRVLHLERGVKEVWRRDGLQAEPGRAVKVGKLKSATSKRSVPLNDTAIAMIQDLRKEAYFGENAPLVPDEHGNYTRPVNFRKRYYRILASAGIEKKGLHSLRHTFASSLVNGIKQEDGSIKSLTPRQVADLLGHSTSQITELYYVKKDTSRLSGITNDFNL